MNTPRDLLADTQRFYRKCVHRSWVHGYLSNRYLAGMIAPAGIGYAPRGWTATSDHLRQLGHAPETIVAAGVAVQTERGLRDVMRDRLTFPVHDHTGNLVAFLGRANPDADAEVPKYLNTPATDLYNKRSTLYGLGERFDALRNGATPLIVEGPMDKLDTDRAVAKSGTSIVAMASCGTSLTREHLARIASVTATPVWVCFDSDQAGQPGACCFHGGRAGSPGLWADRRRGCRRVDTEARGRRRWPGTIRTRRTCGCGVLDAEYHPDAARWDDPQTHIDLLAEPEASSDSCDGRVDKDAAGDPLGYSARGADLGAAHGPGLALAPSSDVRTVALNQRRPRPATRTGRVRRSCQR